MLKKYNKTIFFPLGFNEKGSAIVLAMMVLVVVTIMGITAINLSNTELGIIRNDQIYNQNFYMAEAAVMQAAQIIDSLDGIADYDDLMPSSTTLEWINDNSTGSGTDFTLPANWDDDDLPAAPNNDDNAKHLRFNSNCWYAVNYEGKQAGSSIKSGELSVNTYSLYGLSQLNRGEVLLTIGSKKPVLNP